MDIRGNLGRPQSAELVANFDHREAGYGVREATNGSEASHYSTNVPLVS